MDTPEDAPNPDGEAAPRPGSPRARRQLRTPGLGDPRVAVLGVLGTLAVLGGGYRWLRGVRARRAVERLSDPSVTPEEVVEIADCGRLGFVELVRVFETSPSPEVRAAAGTALNRLWARDQLVAEEEKAIVTRGFQVDWSARRRYPRGLRTPIPVDVTFGVSFIQGDGEPIRPSHLEWTYRIEGTNRASFETPSAWASGPTTARVLLQPEDYASNGPHRLALAAQVRTRGLTDAWELVLPKVPFSFEFDPLLSVGALLTAPDAAREAALARAIRLEPPPAGGESVFLELGSSFALRNPPEIVLATPLPCDLAHRASVEIEGIPGTFPAGTLVVSGQGVAGPSAVQRRPLGPIAGLPDAVIERPGERRLRLVLEADPELGWTDPAVRSVWPGTIVTEWSRADIVRR